MHHYDIAAKVLIDICRDEILRRFLDIEVSRSTLIEALPQETVSVKRSDFPMKIVDANGRQTVVVLEIQTEWLPQTPLHLLDYRIRHMLVSGLQAISAVLLLKPDARATDSYQDAEVHFQYRLIRLYDMDAREALENWPTCLLPFIPLMKYGLDVACQAEQRIYDDPMPSDRRADMLTSMTILSGLVSDKLPMDILSRRRDLMIQSAGYELIKQEGFQQGVLQGKIISSRDALIDLLMDRFDLVPQQIFQTIQQIEDLFVLKALRKMVLRASSIEDFSHDLQRMMQS